jgi:type II secretion system protein N
VSVLAELLELSERQRRLLRWVGYPGFALLTFLLAFYASIPRDRLRDRLERELSQDPSPSAPMGTGMDVSIGDLSLSLVPPGATLRDITLKQRIFPGPGAGPGADDKDKAAKPRAYFIESIGLRASILDLLVGARSGRVVLSGFDGEAIAEARLSGSEVKAELDIKGIALAMVPGLAQVVPLPLTGALTATAEFQSGLDAKTGRLQVASATGLAEISLEDCTIGDGKAKLTVPGDPFLSQGLTFPKVKLGKISGKLVVGKGRATLDQVRTKSADAEASVEGYIELRDPLPLSEVHLYLRFKPTPALIGREPSFELLVNGMAAAKRSDGFLGFSITGPLSHPRGLPAKEPPAGVSVRAAPLTTTGGSEPLGLGMGTPPSFRRPEPPPPAPTLPPPSPEPPPPPSPSSAAVIEAPPPVQAPSMQNFRFLPGALEPSARVAPPPPAPSAQPAPQDTPPPPPAPSGEGPMVQPPSE